MLVITVTNANSCGISPSSSSSWLQITTVKLGTGRIQVSITAAPNTSGQARMGIVLIGDQIYRVIQNPSNATSTITPSPAGASITVTGSSGCAPDAYTTPTNPTWIPPASCTIGFADPQFLAGVPYAFQSSTVTVDLVTDALTINATYAAVSCTGPGPSTHLSVTAPSNATVGVPIQFTVMAVDSDNQAVGTYPDSVHFSSTDGSATLPADVTLTHGVGEFSASLVTAGVQTIAASDLLSPTVTGTSGSITVSQPTAGLHFISMPSCRVVDTRDATKPSGFGPPFIAGDAAGSFVIPNGPCSIPASAQAYCAERYGGSAHHAWLHMCGMTGLGDSSDTALSLDRHLNPL